MFNANSPHQAEEKRSNSRVKKKRIKRSAQSLAYEPLEPKQLLATFTVTNLNDAGAGSLRQAVTDANTAGGADTIDATGVTGIITLTSGQLPVTGSVTINGPGADQLTVSGNNNSRVISTGSDFESGDYTINDLTIANGDENGSIGGGIRHSDNADRLFLNRVSFRDNHANGGGALAVDNMGGIHVMDTAFVDNTVNFGGSAIQVAGGSSNWILNSTLSGNSSNSGAATIEAQVSNGQTQTTRLRNLTITNNTGIGAGVFAFAGSSVTLDVENSIFSDNSGNNLSSGQLATGSATINSSGRNLSDDNAAGFVAGDLTNTDPLLGPLADNGGPTQTHALLTGSPAIDAGLNSAAIDSNGSPFSNDQRQGPFSRIFDGDSSGTATVDIGAFEYYGQLRVDTNTDVVDGDYSSSEFSLREAVAVANAQPGSETITFASGLGTITLGGTQLLITSDVSIEGPGADLLTVDGDGASAVFRVSDSNAALRDVEISGLKIVGGSGAEGVAIDSNENLTVKGVWVADNHSDNSGVLEHRNGALVVSDSTFSGNTGVQGAAIHVLNGTAEIINSTVSGNSATGFGGGIEVVGGTAVVRNSTVTGNRADSDDSGGEVGGGVDGNPNLITMHNTIVAGNFRGSGTTPSDVGISLLSSSSNNLIGDPNSAGGLVHGINGNILGDGAGNAISASTVFNTVLADNGGSTPTHALVSGSAAIDAGSNAQAVDADGNVLTNDQRDAGFARFVDGDNNGTATVDIGAFESEPILIGDVNRDGVVNFLDISPFISLLSAGGFQLEADTNNDGVVNFLDISPFIMLLS